MKTTYLFYAFMMSALVYSTSIFAQEPAPERAKKQPTPEQRIEWQVERMSKQLLLDDETTAQFVPVYKEYLEALINYNKALNQRNALLKSERPIEDEIFLIWEKVMAQNGEIVFKKRLEFINNFTPIFQHYYLYISQGQEKVELHYVSHIREASLYDLLRESRERDRIIGHSLKGIHKDDLEMQLADFPIKREGSQGQNKTYLIALKLAQFAFLKEIRGTTPLLLLDDIFDKLDAQRVEQLIKLTGGDDFGQIFITDTNREHLDRILPKVGSDYKMFIVSQGEVSELSTR